MVLRLAGLAGYGNRSVLDRYRPSMNTNLRRSIGTGCRSRARRGAKIERPNRGSLSGNQITCGRNSVKIRSRRTALQLYGCGDGQPEERWIRLHVESVAMSRTVHAYVDT